MKEANWASMQVEDAPLPEDWQHLTMLKSWNLRGVQVTLCCSDEGSIFKRHMCYDNNKQVLNWFILI